MKNSLKEITRALIDAKKLGHIKTDKEDECQVTTMQSDNLDVKIEFDSFKSVNSIKTENPKVVLCQKNHRLEKLEIMKKYVSCTTFVIILRFWCIR